LNIKLLLRFEDFYQILSNTVVRVFDENMVSISKLNALRLYSNNLAYCIPSLNIIFSSKFARSIYPIVLKQYSHSHSKFITIAKKIYIFSLIRIPLIRFIFSHRVFIFSNNSFFDSYVVQGGSSKIRFIDLSNNLSMLALKDSYSPYDYFYNEVDFRLSNFSKYSLPLYDANLDIFIYSEPYYLNCDYLYYNSSSYGVLKDKVSEIYSSYIDYSCTSNAIRINDYINKILTISENLTLPVKIDSFLNKLSLMYGDVIVPQHFSHGDLQVGNVLIQNNNLFLFDWESCGSRVLFYDLIILATKARLNPLRYVQIISEMYNFEHSKFNLSTLGCDLSLPNGFTFKLFAVSLALENLLYYLVESRNSTITDGASNYILSLNSFITILTNDGFIDG